MTTIQTASAACDDTASGFTSTTPTSDASIADGDYKICVKISDDAANPSFYDDSVTFKRDTVAPTIVNRQR